MIRFVSGGLFLVFLSALAAVLSHPAVLFGFHVPDLSLLAFVAFLPLFWILEGKGMGERLRLVFLFGILFYLGSNYWLYTAMNTFGHLSPAISLLVLFILAFVLSLYFTAIFLFSSAIEKGLKISSFWILPLVWVGVEYFRTRWPMGGFPWGQAGYALGPQTSLIQMSDLTGIYGVTALVVWVNLAGVELLGYFKGRSAKLPFPGLKVGFAFCLLVFAFAYGRFREGRVEAALREAPRLKAALIQGNIPQDEKWIFDGADRILAIYKSLTHRALLSGAELVIWPETAYPYEVALDDPEALSDLEETADQLVLGTVTYESQGRVPRGLPYAPPGFSIHNSAVFWKAGYGVEAAYHKQRLVPYGEYIPLKDILPFVRKLTAQMGEFQRGKQSLLLQEGKAHIGPLICYEDIFPEIAASHARAGADLLLNLTNDAWYGDSSALPQHLNFSVFRAVENHRSVLRATNTGLTASIDPLGRVRKTLPPFQRDYLLDEVAIHKDMSFYSRHGDLFAHACLGVDALLLIAAGALCRKNSRKRSNR